MDQDDSRIFIYSEFYKTTLRVYESNEVIKRYKESYNLVILSFKATIVNDIIKALNIRKATLAPLDNP